MGTCPSCSTPAPRDARFCPRCGGPVGGDDDGTRTAASFGASRDDSTRTSLPTGATGVRVSRLSTLASSLGVEGGLLIPGQLVAGRYRIVARLGAGGMGEVYRAEDLQLGQPVALKFLPASFADDPRRVDAFRNEVRLAREVTHPNVCRVHDIGEVEGQVFLSMEYIDGEDLGTLLRRIGRVPQDRAIEMARQVCSGLAAAHERGVLHRDLKPANIMIDGRGRARLTDFGVAGVVGAIAAQDIRSGTPVYMAPEQLEGHEVSTRSDVYSLGLVLYELFTGRRAFSGTTMAELRAARESSEFTAPTEIVTDLDPAVERVIRRCLDPDPSNRPASAIAVSAALPGGDPLAAALAAGETPSPELVAAAGGEGALTPAQAWRWLLLVVAALGTMLVLAERTSVTGVAPLPKPPDVLEERAREALARLGYPDAPADSDRGLVVDHRLLRTLAAARRGGRVDRALVAGYGVAFWYRQHTKPLEPFNMVGVVTMEDPPVTAPGMAQVLLDASGRLLTFVAPPPQAVDAVAAAAVPVDWKPLFESAGIDPAKATPVPPTWTPSVFADERAAWSAPDPRDPAQPLVLHAAAYRGRVVYAAAVAAGAKPTRGVTGQDEASAGDRAASVLSALLVIGALGTAAVLARRNLRAGRGDKRGAFRMALALFSITLASNLLQSHAPGGINVALQRVLNCGANATMIACLAWLLYLALEPIVRRVRPEGLVAWSRLVAGRVRDPRVGADVLRGMAIGGVLLALLTAVSIASVAAGAPAGLPTLRDLSPLIGSRFAVAALADRGISSFVSAMLMMFFVSLGMLDRKGARFGVPIFFGISLLVFGAGLIANAPLAVAIPSMVIAAALHTLVFYRYGLVAGTVSMALMQWNLPLALDPGSWTFSTTLMLVLVLVAIPVLAFHAALGGRSPFGDPAV